MIVDTVKCYFEQPAEWEPATLPDLINPSAGWSNFTLRQRIESSIIPSAFTQVRFSLRGHPTEGFSVTKAYIGIKGAGPFDFATAPVQIFWNGGNATVTSTPNQVIMSDAVSLTRAGGEDIMISVFTASGNTAADSYTYGYSSTSAPYDAASKAGDDSTTLVASGYTNNGSQWQCYIEDFEVLS